MGDEGTAEGPDAPGGSQPSPQLRAAGPRPGSERAASAGPPLAPSEPTGRGLRPPGTPRGGLDLFTAGTVAARPGSEGGGRSSTSNLRNGDAAGSAAREGPRGEGEDPGPRLHPSRPGALRLRPALDNGARGADSGLVRSPGPTGRGR